MFYAHSGHEDDKSDWQPLGDHLLAVATLAGEMAKPFGLQKAAFYAGLFHDLGKYTAAFQRRLAGADIRVDHSTAGARHILETATGSDRVMAELLAYCILGHHAGLPDMLGTESAFATRLGRPAAEQLDPAWKTDLVFDAAGLAPAFDWQETKDNSENKKKRLAFQVAFLGRMLFSCLVDADFKDTETFYTALEGRLADRDWQPLQDLLPGFLTSFDRHMAGKISTAGDLNRLRSDILAHVRAKAAEKPGLFTLTVPTGGGKTLASLAFALDHAKIHGHTRVIYAIPFTSIIDQTADIFRSILGQEHVLEHHSAIDEEKFDPKERKESRDKLKLAMEDWAAPVVVTTNVQLFESLFAAKTSRSRKIHNIAGSVIILDEAWIETREMDREDSDFCRLPRGGVDRNAWARPSAKSNRVASRAEAWIETITTRRPISRGGVASRAEAWIETQSAKCSQPSRRRRLPRGGVDRNPTSHAVADCLGVSFQTHHSLSEFERYHRRLIFRFNRLPYRPV